MHNKPSGVSAWRLFVFCQISLLTIFPRNLGVNLRLYIRQRPEMTPQNEKFKEGQNKKGN
jgi:hypothetical protein